MSITEALEAVKAFMFVHDKDEAGWVPIGHKKWVDAYEDYAKGIAVLEAYIQTHEGQGGLGL